MNKQTPFGKSLEHTSASAEIGSCEGKETSSMLCAEWAAKVEAAFPGGFSPAERDAFERHAASCEACASVRADYESMSALLHSFPIPESPVGVPSRLRRLWEDESHPAGTMAASLETLSLYAPMAVAYRGRGWREEMEGCDNEIDQKTVMPMNFYKPIRTQAERPRRIRGLLAS